MAKYKMKYTYYSLLAIVGVVIQILLVLKSANNSNDNCPALIATMNLKNLPVPPSQIIVVKSIGEFKAEITACQQQRGTWQRVFPPFLGVIGKGGVALVGEKKEGDFKTPAGLYPLGEAFGSQPMGLKMDYKYITPDDKFVDDVTSKSYNTWINGKTEAKSYELMLVKPYKMGVVINYNMNPVTIGSGSAIFMHLWQSQEVATLGCVAMDEQHMLALLYWLDKKQHPYIYITI